MYINHALIPSLQKYITKKTDYIFCLCKKKKHTVFCHLLKVQTKALQWNAFSISKIKPNFYFLIPPRVAIKLKLELDLLQCYMYNLTFNSMSFKLFDGGGGWCNKLYPLDPLGVQTEPHVLFSQFEKLILEMRFLSAKKDRFNGQCWTKPLLYPSTQLYSYIVFCAQFWNLLYEILKQIIQFRPLSNETFLIFILAEDQFKI